MQRAYCSAWGAHVTDRGVRFRLWAPAASAVNVVTFGPERTVPMNRSADGWFETIDAGSGAGTRYMYEIDAKLRVADPASRFQPDGAEAPSEVVDPRGFSWPDREFALPPWHEAVIYELHVGAFTPEGTYEAASRRLDHVAALGATAIELMPLSQAPGSRNWGYDGVLHYAPSHCYGTPDDLKRLIVAAHDRGLAVLLDVVYNHFGPQGNYLPAYAPQFFNQTLQTPWGAGIDYSSPQNDPVRRYAIDNACYWLTEYAFDGLRLDAAAMIADSRPVHVLTELLEEARTAAARRVYLIAEDVKNEAVARFAQYDGRWSDDTHDALYVLMTGDNSPYYRPFRDAPLQRMMQTLLDERMHVVEFLQDHDQVGNRPFGDRIASLVSPEALRAALAIVLLAPAVPLLFMGEEWCASTPFLFFCDFEPSLRQRVREGRLSEFSLLAEFADPAAREKIPDPGSAQSFERSKLRWEEPSQPAHRAWLEYYRRLLAIRRALVERYAQIGEGTFRVVERCGVEAVWNLKDGSLLRMRANLSATELRGFTGAAGRTIYATHEGDAQTLAPWSVRWDLAERTRE